VRRSFPFLLRKRSHEEIAEYDIGFQAGSNAEEADDAKSEAWQRGRIKVQEWEILEICNFSSRFGWMYRFSEDFKFNDRGYVA
jgi:hypothetical protein